MRFLGVVSRPLDSQLAHLRAQRTRANVQDLCGAARTFQFPVDLLQRTQYEVVLELLKALACLDEIGKHLLDGGLFLKAQLQSL